MRISDWSSDVCSSDLPYSQQLSNIADVTQNGDNGSVEVDQTGNNRAQVHQAYAPGEGQSAIIDQETVPGDGTENYAATHQRGNDLSADTTQNGGNNRGIVSQQLSGNADSSIFRSEEHTSELQSLMRISYAV